MTFTDDEKKLMDDVMKDLHELFSVMQRAAEFKAWLFEGDWFLNYCKEYITRSDPTGLKLGLLMYYDSWVSENNG